MHHTTLIVPGFHGSGHAHWQSWMEKRLPAARRVGGIDWEVPVLALWAGEVRREIDAAPGAVWIVAHSFGCLASVIAAADLPDRVAGVLLVAPDEPRRFSLFGTREQYPGGDSVASALPPAPLPSPSVLVASRNDPWLAFDRAHALAELVDIGDAGHINTESGYGPWPQGLDLLAELQLAFDGFPLGALGDAPHPGTAARCSALARLRRQTRANMGA